MYYPLYLGRRLSLGSGGRKASPGVKVAIAAIALSVAVMTASIAIVLGFKREITDKVVGLSLIPKAASGPRNGLTEGGPR